MEKKSLLERLNGVQKELKAPKSQFNKFGNFNYRSCEDILESVKPILHKYGLTLWIDDEIVNIGDRFYVKATAHLSTIDGVQSLKTSTLARESYEKKSLDTAQVTGLTLSYCHKYLLGNIFLVDDSTDHDSDVHQPEETAKKVTPFTKKTKKKDEFEPSDELDEYIGGISKVTRQNKNFYIYDTNGNKYITIHQDYAKTAKKALELNCECMIFHKNGLIETIDVLPELDLSKDEKVEKVVEEFNGEVVI